MDYYETFRQMLHVHPAGAPPSPAIDEILHILFTEDEIRIAVHMSYAPKSLGQISQAASITQEETQQRLDTMAANGVIISRLTKKGLRYAILPIAPGLCENSIKRSEGTPLYEKLRSLWKHYREDGMIATMWGDPTPLMRVIPIESALSPKSHILPYESVSNLIRSSGTIVVSDCSCRAIEQHCNAPKETCFNFGSVAEFLIEKSLGRRVSPEEALAILDETEKAGLVHCANNSADKADKICNCCSCCCLYLRGLLEFDNPHAVATSSYSAHVREDTCTGCGICYSGRCRVKAIVPQENKARVLTEKCIGCGLCATACPEGSIELIRRDNPPVVPATLMDMGSKVLMEKGKMDAFMEVMMK
jgi:Na+-translocating ferredoxin:NAD+ oxidoreductase subunit B